MPYVDPNFRKRLDKVIRIVLQELKDGCPDCWTSGGLGGFCQKHLDEARVIIHNPRGCEAVQKLLGTSHDS